MKPLIKSGRRPDAISIGMLNAKMIVKLGKSINEARELESKVEQARKTINTTNPKKYILFPSLIVAKCDVAFMFIISYDLTKNHTPQGVI